MDVNGIFPLENNQPRDLLNGFPIECPRPEGIQSTWNPFNNDLDSYIPIALVNRFDLAPVNGENCGEYRIIFAKQSGQSRIGDRNLIIFEGVEPNYQWQMGLAGCAGIQQMWQNLGASQMPLTGAAGKAIENPPGPENVAGDLRAFFFDGWQGWDPVVMPSHYGAVLNTNNGCSTGQIRTDQFMTDDFENDPNPNKDSWTLREFKLIQDCRCATPCPLEIVPVSVKQNPYGDLFNSGSPIYSKGGVAAAAFGGANGDFAVQALGTLSSQAQLLIPWGTQVPLPANFTSFSYLNFPDRDNAGESESLVVATPQQSNDYPSPLPVVAPAIQGDLDQGYTTTLTNLPLPHNLAAGEVVSRARALSCAGCHQLSGGGIDPNNGPPAPPGFNQDLGGLQPWPPSLNFTHVSERIVAGAAAFPVSPFLTSLMLPNRMAILQQFLAHPPQQQQAPNACPLPLAPSLSVLCANPPQEIFDPVGLRQMEPQLQPDISPINF